MGVDAMIFARESKKCFYFDRRFNFLDYSQYGGNISDDQERYTELLSLCNKRDAGLTLDDVRLMVKLNIEEYSKDTADAHRVRWNELILKFAEAYPADRFFVVSDHDDPSYHDVIRNDGYERVEHAWTDG